MARQLQAPDSTPLPHTVQYQETIFTFLSRLAAALVPADGPAPDPAALDCVYRAAAALAPATGWPVRAAATRACTSPAGCAKEYDPPLQQL